MGFGFWLLIGALVGAAMLSHGLRHWLPLPYAMARVQHIETADGWPLVLYHFPASGESSKGVVVLSADLGEAPQLWSWGDTGGWAQALCEAGYDVWIASLRGAAEEPRRFDPRHGWGWWAEAHIEWDLPALLDVVEKASDGRPIHWLGRGFGGVLPLLSPTQQARLASVSVLGAGLGSQPWLIDLLIKQMIKWWPLPSFPMRRLYQLALPLRLLLGWGQQLFKRRPFTSSQEAWALLQQCTHGFSTTSTPALSQWLYTLEHAAWLPPTDSAPCDRDGLSFRVEQSPSCPTRFLGEWQKDLALPEAIEQEPFPVEALQASAADDHALRALAPLLDDDLRQTLCQDYLAWLKRERA